MKRYICSILATALLLASCQQEGVLSGKGNGYLVLGGLSALSPVTEAVGTRAVDAGLYIRIGEAVYEPGSDALQGKIELEAGGYVLEAYNDAYGNQASNAAQYYAAQPFTIEDARTSYVNLEVPMINVAVKLDEFAGELEALFTDPYVTVSANNTPRTITPGETAYFDYAEGMSLSYTLTATNADGEKFTSEPSTYGGNDSETVEAGHCYVIAYSLEDTRTVTSSVR